VRIVGLTPGTGTFYCGTCLRDNWLGLALKKLGHEMLVAPMYLPVLSEGPNLADGAPMFFGGINVYLQQYLPWFRSTPRWIDRIFDSPAALRLAARRAGMTAAKHLGDLTCSMLKGEEGHQAKELDRLIAWLKSDGKPDVVCLSNVLLAGVAGRIKRDLGVPVVCTLQGEDFYLDSLLPPWREQAWAELSARAQHIDAFIAVSQYYGDVMQKRLGLPPEKVHVVHNGILLDGYEPAAQSPNPPVIGFLSRLCHMKGLDTFIEAFVILKQRGRTSGLKLRAAGTMTKFDEPFVGAMRKRLATSGFLRDAEFLPNVSREEKQAFLKTVSVLSVPATYGESFGLYLLEALAAGVPVVQPRHAAFPELIEATGGGKLCEPDSPESLALELENLLVNQEEAQALGRRGREAVNARFTMERMGEGVAKVLQRVSART